MSSSKAPKTPDYTGAAIAQGQADKEIAQYLTQANRVNQVDPYGQTTWTQAADPAADAAKKEYDYWQNYVSGGAITDGRDRSAADVAWATSHQLKDAQTAYDKVKGNGQWTQTTTLTPDQQKLLNQQQFISQMQNDRIAGLIRDTGNPTKPTLGGQRDLQQYGLSPERALQERQLQTAQMSPERQLQATQLAPDRQLQQAQMSPQRQLEIAQMGPARELQKRELEQRQMADQRQLKDADRNDIQDLLYKQITKQYGDRFAKEEASQRAQLANQGFQSGSEGFSNQLTDFNRERNSAYEDAAVSAALASYDQTNKDRALNQSEYGLLSSDDLNRYNAQTSNDLNRFNSLSANDLNQWGALTSNDLNRFNSQQSANLGNFNAQTSDDLNRFNSQTSANLGNFNALTANDLNRYNSQSTQNRGNFDSQNANDLNRFQAQTTANLGNFGAQTAYDLDRFNSQSSNDLSRFGALNADALNRFSALSSDDLNRYNSQLGQYNSDQGFLSQLLGGVAGPTNPQYQPYAQATPYQSPDLLGAMQGQYQGNLNRTNARNASNSSNMQTAGVVAAAAATAF